MQPKPKLQRSGTTEPNVSDLCDTCLQGQTCHFREMPTQPIHECNEYDDGARPELQLPTGLLSVPSAARVAGSEVEGLCMNCDHRQGCTLPRPVGGVWHCEEYR